MKVILITFSLKDPHSNIFLNELIGSKEEIISASSVLINEVTHNLNLARLIKEGNMIDDYTLTNIFYEYMNKSNCQVKILMGYPKTEQQFFLFLDKLKNDSVEYSLQLIYSHQTKWVNRIIKRYSKLDYNFTLHHVPLDCE